MNYGQVTFALANKTWPNLNWIPGQVEYTPKVSCNLMLIYGQVTSPPGRGQDLTELKLQVSSPFRQVLIPPQVELWPDDLLTAWKGVSSHSRPGGNRNWHNFKRAPDYFIRQMWTSAGHMHQKNLTFNLQLSQQFV